MRRRRIAGAVLEGAMGMLSGGAMFDRAGAILRFEDNGLLHAHRWSGDEVIGDALAQSHFEDFIASKQAFRWGHISAETIRIVPHVAIWVIQQHFDNIERIASIVKDLVNAEGWLATAIDSTHRATLVVVREDRANAVRDKWAHQVYLRAKSAIVKRDWKKAFDVAELSYEMTRGLLPERTALYSLMLEKCGDPVRAEGIVVSAERSRNKDFGAQLQASLKALRQEIDSPVPGPDLEPRTLAKIDDGPRSGVSNRVPDVGSGAGEHGSRRRPPPGVKEEEIPRAPPRFSFTPLLSDRLRTSTGTMNHSPEPPR